MNTTTAEKNAVRGRPKAPPHSRIEARLAPEKKQVMEQAAEIKGMSLTDFVVDSAYSRAVRTVRDHEVWVLSREQSEFIMNCISNPPEPSEEVRATFARYFALRTEA